MTFLYTILLAIEGGGQRVFCDTYVLSSVDKFWAQCNRQIDFFDTLKQHKNVIKIIWKPVEMTFLYSIA